MRNGIGETTPEEAAQRLSTLTGREMQVLALVVAGRTNKQIGRKLGISYRTVEVHRAHAMDKLGAESVLDLGRISAMLPASWADER